LPSRTPTAGVAISGLDDEVISQTGALRERRQLVMEPTRPIT